MKNQRKTLGYKPMLAAIVIASIVATSCSKDDSLDYRTRRTGTTTTPPPTTTDPAPAAPTAPAGNLKFDISWEQSDALSARSSGSTVAYFPNSIENPGTGPKPVIVTDPTNAANKVLNITVNNNSKDGTRIRTEMTAWNLTAGLKQKSAYGFRVYIPADFKTDQNAMNFVQLHDVSPYGRIPAISFMLKAKQLDLNVAWATTPNSSRHQGDIHKFLDVTNWFGRWVNVVMEVNWFQDASGYVKLYFDGSLVYTYNGPVGYAGDAQGPYFKWGLHYPGGILPAGSTTTSQRVLYDNIRIGNGVSYADVK